MTTTTTTIAATPPRRPGFELLLIEQTNELVKNALLELADVALNRFTHGGFSYWRWQAECDLVYSLAVEWLPIVLWRGTLIERVYSVKRQRIGRRSSNVRTNKYWAWSTLGMLVVVYVARRAHRLVQSPDYRSRYPHLASRLDMLSKMSRFSYRMAYLARLSGHWSPLMHAFGQEYVLDEDDDGAAVSGGSSTPKSPTAIDRLMQLAQLGITFLRFTEWWQMNGLSQIAFKEEPVPYPLGDLEDRLAGEEEALTGADASTDAAGPTGTIPTKPLENMCSVCHRLPRNPTAVIQTGRVYCFICLSKLAKTHSPMLPGDFDLQRDGIRVMST